MSVAEVKYLGQANGVNTPAPTPVPLDVGTPVNPTHAVQLSQLTALIPTNTTSLALTVGASITISSTALFQNIRVKSAAGGVALSTTPFGGVAPADGAVIKVAGCSDADYPIFADADIDYGVRMNGTKDIKNGDTLQFIFNLSMKRYCQL